PALLGDWISTNQENKGVLEFVALNEDGKDVGYTITLLGQEEDGKCSRMEYDGRQVKIGDRKFLDLVPKYVDLRPAVTPSNIVQSKNGAAIRPGRVKVATSGYMQLT